MPRSPLRSVGGTEATYMELPGIGGAAIESSGTGVGDRIEILVIVPIKACLRRWGLGPALVVAAIAATVGDYFFVHLVGAVTVHAEGPRLLIRLLLGTLTVSLVAKQPA